MSSYLRDTLRVKCPLIATADHSHSGSGYSLEADAQQLDIMDSHDYWLPGVAPYRHNSMVNEPFNSTVAELSRTGRWPASLTQVSEVNNPFPNQFACEGIPILKYLRRFSGVECRHLVACLNRNAMPTGNPFLTEAVRHVA